jgi:hypothetical protein
MKLRITSALAFVSFASFASLAVAQTPPPAAPAPTGQPGAAPAPGGKPQAWQKPCEADVQKFCTDALKTGQVPDCLAKHEKDLSEECTKSFLYRYQAAQMCKDDFEKYCKDKMGPGGGLGQCIHENEKNLSDKCKAALAKGSKQAKVQAKAEAKAEGATDAKAEEAPKTAAKTKRKKKPAAP